MRAIQFTSTLFPFLCSLAVAAAPQATEAQEAGGPATVATPSIEGGIASIMTAPLVDDSIEEGTVWVRTRTMRARFDDSGGTVYPVFGRASERERPVHFDVSDVRLAGEPIPAATTASPMVKGETVVQPRGGFREVHHLGLDGIEQTFVFDELPVRGELTLELTVETDLQPLVNGTTLRFDAGPLGYVDYGTALVLDAAGATLPIERLWTGAGIEFRVPAHFVENAALPLTIDPVWTTYTNGFGLADDADPAVLYAGVNDQFLVVWNEYTSAQNLDIYGSRYSASLGDDLEGIAIESTNESWEGPASAYSYATDRALIAAVRDSETVTGAVVGRLLNVGSAQLDPGTLTISSTGFTAKTSVDVGGSNLDSVASSHFCVTWSRRQVTPQTDVEYRILEADGSPVTDVRKVSDRTHDEIQPSISAGLGDTNLTGDNWHIVWTEDLDGDEKGRIMVKRIYFSGNEPQDSEAYALTADVLFSYPTVSSLTDAPLPWTGERCAVVAFQRDFADITSPTGFQSDILTAVISGDEERGITSITTAEDFDSSLQQRRPVVSTNGRSFYVAYQEESYLDLGAEQWDVYLAAGEIVPTTTQGYLALAERHLLLENSSDPANDLDIVSRWEGEHISVSSRCLVVWSADESMQAPGFGEIRGAGYQFPITKVSQQSALGRQFCDANPNSTGNFSGRQSSWIRATGTGSVNDTVTAEALDLPINAFGYLLVSATTGDQNMPGGSAGRLCLGGSIGRYIDQVQSSGMSGRIAVTVDPLSIPQPNGAVAATPGQTWRFQFWHRDSDGGQPTSNFTNACSVRFMN